MFPDFNIKELAKMQGLIKIKELWIFK